MGLCRRRRYCRWAGTVWDGARYDWGVARLTPGGTLDATFDGDGLYFFGVGPNSAINALAVQADGKILVAGGTVGDFAMARLTVSGGRDQSFGAIDGFAINDLGGTEAIAALAVANNGWIYAAGGRATEGTFDSDMALAQYTPDGRLATCADPGSCQNWPAGTFFVNAGRDDYARALDLRSDNQLVAGGCSSGHFTAVQVRTDGPPTPLPFNTDFVGDQDCARGVKFSGVNHIVLAGGQDLSPYSSDYNIALTRFETTPDNTLPPPPPPPPATNQPVFLPVIVRQP